MATTTVFPDPSVESTSVDGMLEQAYSAGSGVSWATIIAAAGSSARDNSADDSAIRIEMDTGSNTFRGLRRGAYLFDTSAITDTDVISAATLSLFGFSKSDAATAITPDINIYSSAPASNTALASGDFDSLGTTAFSTAITYASFSTVAYNDFALNASGIAAIDKAGITKMGARNANYDVAASPPTWSSATDHRLEVLTADQAGTGSDPKLVITHAAPAAATNTNLLLLGVG